MPSSRQHRSVRNRASFPPTQVSRPPTSRPLSRPACLQRLPAPLPPMRLRARPVAGEATPTEEAMLCVQGRLQARTSTRELSNMLEVSMPDLPSGTVTFLFTDIEGSTALWERDRAAMRAAVDAAAGHPAEPHRRPSRGPLQDRRRWHPSRLCLRRGRAARRRRRANGRCWPKTGPIRPDRCGCAWRCMPGKRRRMRGATTWPLPSTGSSRLLATGHGGQILLTQTVQQLTRGALPAGADAARPGRAPAARSARAGAGLPAAAPGPAGRRSRPSSRWTPGRHNLPRQPTPVPRPGAARWARSSRCCAAPRSSC